MKRYLSILMILLLLISALAGCGAKSESEMDYAAPQAAPEAAAPEEYAEEEVLYDEVTSESGTGSTVLPESHTTCSHSTSWQER